MCHALQQAAGKLGTLGAKGRVCEGNPREAQQPIHLLAVNPTSTYQVSGSINNSPVLFMIDTGAAVTLLRKDIWDAVNTGHDALEPWVGPGLVGVEGTPICVHGTTKTMIQLEGQAFLAPVVVADSLRTQAILGADFLEQNQCIIDTGNRTLRFGGKSLSVTLCSPNPYSVSTSVNLVLQENVSVPAFSEIEVMAKADTPLTSETWLIEDRLAHRTQLVVANAVVMPPSGESSCVIRIINPTKEAITVHKGTKAANMETINDVMVAEIGTDQHLNSLTEEKQKLLREMVDRTEDELSQSQREKLYDLLADFADVFASSDTDLGRTRSIKHQIETGSAAPIRQPARRVPPHRREIVRDLLREMQDKEVVQPSKSPWASPIVLVQKRDGSWRFCVDYRKLNAVTRKDAYPLPRIDDTLAGSQWFTTLDLLSGYWQVEVEEKDKEKTAFCTPEGLYEFLYPRRALRVQHDAIWAV